MLVLKELPLVGGEVVKETMSKYSLRPDPAIISLLFLFPSLSLSLTNTHTPCRDDEDDDDETKFETESTVHAQYSGHSRPSHMQIQFAMH